MRPLTRAVRCVAGLATAALGLACAPPLTEEGRAQLAEAIRDKPLMRMMLAESAGISQVAKPDDAEIVRRARGSEVYRSLDFLRREVGEDAVAERIRTLNGDYGSLEAAAMWLHDQYFRSSSPRPSDGLWYFDALMLLYDAPSPPDSYQRGVGGLAVAAWVSSQLLALENHARCEDRTGGLTYLQNWERDRRESVERVWKALSPRDQRAALRGAQRHTQRAADRSPDPRPCASGIATMRAAMDAGRCVERTPPPNADEYVGGRTATFVHCDGEDFVRFVDDETWRARLPALQARYWDRLFAPKSASKPAKDVASPTP